ncbi:hypothetical protein RJ55_01962 [Drechmeria coniospora]|nr:hypothetical protein RJ55_01962 [Drechmeria coniospora]
MPSFLNGDAPPPIFSSDLDVLDLDLDPGNRFGLASNRKGADGAPSFGHTRSGLVKGSYDESSTLSTHDSDISDAAPMATNGNGTRPTSTGSLANGKLVLADAGASGAAPAVFESPSRGPMHHPPDRTGPPPPAPGGDDDYDDAAESWPPHPRRRAYRRSSLASDRDGPTAKAPDELPPLSVPHDAYPHSPKSHAASFERVHQSFDLASAASSPKRFSSPAAYYSPAGASTASPTKNQQPAPAGLAMKHRHTLEVPKIPSGRHSKDGADAHASGRFSPAGAGSSGARRASLNLVRRTTRSTQPETPRDGVVVDEDAVRWTEAYRQRRASKRRKKEEEDDGRVLVGTKVDESHANWVTAYNMLTGIRVSVSRTNAKLDRELTNADFEAKQKSTFDITGNELVPSAKYDFKFKDYAPWVFRRLRSLFRLDPADYLMSLTGKYILSELGSPGKSGSFFYFSRDYKYIIKTIHHAEHKFLRKILKEYYNHVRDNPNTLLSQFYGLHRVKMPYGKKIHFVVMNNLFPPHRDIHTTFDLKGSTVGREYKEEDLAQNPRATLKDLNWLRRQQHLELGMQKKRLFLEQLQRDVALLKRLQIMDYSLLIGIHDLSRGNEENLRGKTLQVFNPGGEKSAEDDAQSLLRTPSKLENFRKANELRQMIRQKRPVPMGQADGMPDELDVGHSRSSFIFNQDDGGFRATHEDNTPADEVYYLGVIDCLTHYGMIKKIENFWKGLSNDRTQISALPPDQYGDRFYHFVEGITLSAEEATREAQRRDQEAMDAARASASALASRRDSGHQSHHAIPAMPDYQPPACPAGRQPPEGREAIEMAAPEKDIPDRTLKTRSLASDQRDSFQQLDPILPIVEEIGESGRNDDGVARGMPASAKGKPTMPPPPTGPPPPPPPARSQAAARSDGSDSGYGGNSNGSISRDNSLRVRRRPSKESVDKPKRDEAQDGRVRMAA